MTFDPTTNRIPFELLTDTEKVQLKAWPHGWEFYILGHGWTPVSMPSWYGREVYRAKPAPAVKSLWRNVYLSTDKSTMVTMAVGSREAADRGADDDRIGVVRFDLIDGVLSVELEPLEDKQ
jgi:hypothetical protein